MKNSKAKKIYIRHKDPFNQQRHLAWSRARAQAAFRDEQWQLTFNDWCHFWSTEELWAQRGRANESLCLTRYDETAPWSLKNCCLIKRYNHLRIKNRKRWDLPADEFYQGAIFYDDARLRSL